MNQSAIFGVSEDGGDGREPYGFSWPGKGRAAARAATPAAGSLSPRPEASLDFERAAHAVIEGDNLAVLGHLRKSYSGRVKMIYIDPPYNTGRAFLYPDNFRDTPADHRRRAGEGAEPEGRYHARWLNMMYPRLLLARDLLRDDGVLFVSIDDHEVHALRLMLDEIFGSRNFFAMFPWQSRTSRQNDTDLCVQHEYVIGYARRRRVGLRRLSADNQAKWRAAPGFAAYPARIDTGRYRNPDNDPRGPWKLDPFDAPNVRPRLTYTIRNPDTGQAFRPPPGRCWRTGPERFEALLADRRILFGRRGRARPQLKVFLNEKRAFGEVATSWLDGTGHGTASDGTRELQALFDGESPFLYPKPTKLLRFLLRLATGPDDLVLDFFAGSGSTGQAVLAENRDDGGRRRCLLVQLAEPTGDPRWPTLADLTAERLRRAAAALGGDQGFRFWRHEDGPPAATDPWSWLAPLGLPLDARLEPVTVNGERAHWVKHGQRVWLLYAGTNPDEATWKALRGAGADVVVLHRALFAGRRTGPPWRAEGAPELKIVG